MIQSDGIVYFYDISNDNLEPIGQPLDSGNGSWSTLYGFSASSDLETVALTYPNVVKVFRLNNSNWDTEFSLEIKRPLGVSISEDGNKLTFYDEYSNNGQGSIQLFHFYDSDWHKVGMTQVGLKSNAQLGEDLRISKDGYIVGAMSGGSLGSGNAELQQYQFDDICGRLFYEPQHDDDCAFKQPYRDDWPFDDEGYQGTAIIEPGSINVESNDMGYWHLPSLADGDYSMTAFDSLYQHLCQDTLFFSVANNRLTTTPPEWAFNERLFDNVFIQFFSDRNDDCQYDSSLEETWRNVDVVVNPGNISLNSGINGTVNVSNLTEGEYTLSVIDSDFTFPCDSSVTFIINNIDSTILLPAISLQKPNNVSGVLYKDENVNCRQNSDEKPLADILVKLTTVSPEIYTNTNENGEWTFKNVPLGDHEVVFLNDSLYISCKPIEFDVGYNEEEVNADDIGLVDISPCIHTKVNGSMFRLRPCFDKQLITFKAANRFYSVDTLFSPYVEVQLEDWVSLDSCSHEYSIDSTNLITVQINDLAPGESEFVKMYITPDCDKEIGTALCVTYKLLPVDTCMLNGQLELNLPRGGCSEAWDGSHINVSRSCDEDSIRFFIENNSSFDMECFRPIFLYKDFELIMEDSVKLNANEKTSFSIKAERNTFVLTCDQHPLHPGKDRPVAFVENCGTEGVWTPDLIEDGYLNTLDPHVDVDCRVLTAAYDPNDKVGTPRGIGDENCIEPNEPIQYRIRFQNTGNDTAFNVFIIDTIDVSVFDIESLNIGLSSHGMTYELSGQGIIRFNFDNILLPDSTTNELASNGYVDFTLGQKRSLQDGTVINNDASIYFDFNDPIVTNTSFHTVRRRQSKIISNIVEIEDDHKSQFYVVSPNPSKGQIEIMSLVKDVDNQNSLYQIYDISGRELRRGLVRESGKVTLPENSGIYFLVIKINENYKEVYRIMRMD